MGSPGSEKTPLTPSKEAMYAQPHTDGSRIYLQARDFFEVKANDVSKAKAEDPPLSTLRTFKLNSTSEITILVNQRD